MNNIFYLSEEIYQNVFYFRQIRVENLYFLIFYYV
jgi:hypothetical protein